MAQVQSGIASNIKAMLAARDMTIKEFAERAGLHYTTARRFVDGYQENINKTVLYAACKALGCDVGDIFEAANEEE